MREIVTTCHLPAPPAVVWGVLADLPRWPSWNASVEAVEGRFERDARLRMTLTVGSRRVTVPVTLVTLEARRELAWKGGVPGITQALHGFVLQAEEQGTRLEHYERFYGVIPHLAWPWLPDRLMPRYRATNEGLARVLTRG